MRGGLFRRIRGARLGLLVALVAGVVLAQMVGSSDAGLTRSVIAYVTNSGGNTVTPIDVATNTAGTPVTVGNQPNEVAITPDGKTAYVTNLASGTVTPITVATNTAGTPITVGSDPDGIAITPAPTAAAQLATLRTAVTGVGPGSSLADKVTLIQGYVAANDKADACGTLGAFINEVNAQTGKKITRVQAAQLIAQARNIEATLGC